GHVCNQARGPNDGNAIHVPRLLRACRERPSGRRATEQRDELASFQLIKWHSVPCQPGPDCRISNGGGQSGGIRAFAQSASRSPTHSQGGSRILVSWSALTYPSFGPEWSVPFWSDQVGAIQVGAMQWHGKN